MATFSLAHDKTIHQERVLTSKQLPSHVLINAAHMLKETYRIAPPLQNNIRRIPLKSEATTIGQYLYGFGYAYPEQIQEALDVQKTWKSILPPPMLGDLLVQQMGISAYGLAATLVIQGIERMLSPQYRAPNHMGEWLLHQGMLSPSQLARALYVQTMMRQNGEPIPFGEVLVYDRILTRDQVNELLNNWMFVRF